MGRSSVVYVIGLTLIVGLVLRNIAQNSISAMNVYYSYYGSTQVHTIADAGANIGTSYLLNYKTIPANFGVNLFGGHDTVIFLANTPQPLWVTIKSIATSTTLDGYGTPLQEEIDGVFKHVQFAKFAWFTESETNGYKAPDGTLGPYYGASDWKVTGDSVFGPAHTNGAFNLDGTPYFAQKVTSVLPLNLGPSAAPVFMGGFEKGVLQTRPNTSTLQANLTAAATLGGSLFDETSGSNDVALTFLNDKVRVQIPPGGGIRDTTMAISALAPNGVVVVKSADLHIKGTYQGDLTVAAFGGSNAATNKGNVWIDGDVVAKTDPYVNSASTDMLGIVAGRMAYITQDLMRSTSTIISIDAAIYCQNGELTAENFWNLPPSGRVDLFGGVTQITAGSLGILNPGPPVTVLSGFSYSIKNDPRFDSKQPPFFPYSDSYQLLSWWEN